MFKTPKAPRRCFWAYWKILAEIREPSDFSNLFAYPYLGWALKSFTHLFGHKSDLSRYLGSWNNLTSARAPPGRLHFAIELSWRKLGLLQETKYYIVKSSLKTLVTWFWWKRVYFFLAYHMVDCWSFIGIISPLGLYTLHSEGAPQTPFFLHSRY